MLTNLAKSFPQKAFAPVAQLDSASVFGTEGWGFESLRAYILSPTKYTSYSTALPYQKPASVAMSPH